MAKQAWEQNSSDNWRSLQQQLLFTCPLISYLSRKEGVWSLLLALSWCPAFSITPSSEESKWRCSLMLAGLKQWKVPSSVHSGKGWLRCVLQQSKVQLKVYDTKKLIIKMYLLGFPGGAVVENQPANEGTWVQALVWEDPTCRGATGPASHNYWACASGACAPKQERPR